MNLEDFVERDVLGHLARALVRKGLMEDFLSIASQLSEERGFVIFYGGNASNRNYFPKPPHRRYVHDLRFAQVFSTMKEAYEAVSTQSYSADWYVLSVVRSWDVSLKITHVGEPRHLLVNPQEQE